MGVERVWRVECDACHVALVHDGATRTRAVAAAREYGARPRSTGGAVVWECESCRANRKARERKARERRTVA